MGLLDKIYSALGGLLIAGACALTPQTADAEVFEHRRHETAEQRAQGGAGLALDRHVPSNMAFSEPGFNIGLLRLDYDGSLSEILRLRDAFDDNPFADAFEDGLSPSERIDEFLSVTDNSISLDTRLYFDFLRLSYTRDDHTVYLGGYGDIEAGIALAGPNALSSRSLVVEGHTLNDFIGWYDPEAPEYFAFRLLTVIGDYVDSPDAHLDIGDRFTLLRMIGRADLGCYMGYARRFGTQGDAEIGVGVQARYFHRWLSDYYSIQVNGVIDSLDDITVPEHRGVEGDGIALDLFTTVRFNDPVFNTILTAGIDNIGVVWYDDGSAEFEMPRPSVGIALHPL
ncbi:hypothetical protein KY362_06975, partial [Candidatus Woesearchaeota archaeon]|nr:hypothetical protein [Candidatus Woesearchaeota archaeon]